MERSSEGVTEERKERGIRREEERGFGSTQ
jgi:hypothetical protein